jgi:pimeloyl-ACP methyl ester carboxylesterase
VPDREHRSAGNPGSAAPEARDLIVAVEGVPLHLVVQGEGAPVVFVHGARGSAFDFTYRLLPLVATRYTAIAFDRPGSGSSGRAPGRGSPAVHARLLHGALERLGVERPLLVGHSLGAALVMVYAATYPDDVAGVVTLCGHVVPYSRTFFPSAKLMTAPGMGSLVLATLLSPAGRLVAPSVLRRVFSPHPAPPDYARRAVATALAPGQIRADGEDLQATDPGLREVIDRFVALDLPATIVACEGDRVIPRAEPGELARRMPQARLVTLPHASHVPHVSVPEAVVGVIDEAMVRA